MNGRTYAIYVRTNRRVKWQYAEYRGRWSSVEEAIEEAKSLMNGEPFEYRVENIGTDEVFTGFVNWKRREVTA